MTWNNVQPPCNTCVHCAQSSQDHRNHQCSTIPHVAYFHSQVAVLRQLLSMFLANFAISRTADINKTTSVCLLISETDVRTIDFDLPCSGDGGIPHHSNVIRLHKPIRMMPVPLVLCRAQPDQSGYCYYYYIIIIIIIIICCCCCCCCCFKYDKPKEHNNFIDIILRISQPYYNQFKKKITIIIIIRTPNYVYLKIYQLHCIIASNSSCRQLTYAQHN